MRKCNHNNDLQQTNAENARDFLSCIRDLTCTFETTDAEQRQRLFLAIEAAGIMCRMGVE
jgi:hypothetical protein